MKPVDFDYAAPERIEEALALLRIWNAGAKILAGGQSLLPLLVTRSLRPDFVIDINRIQALDFIEQRGSGVAIGATVRQAKAERSDIIRSRCPLLAEALYWVAVPQIRSRGTVIGSLAQRNAISQIPTVAVVTGARLTVIDKDRRQRVVDAEMFLNSDDPETLKPHELVTEAWFPEQGPGSAWAFTEVQKRQAHYALVGVAVTFDYDDDGKIAAPRVAASGISNRPVRLRSVEAALQGKVPTEKSFADASQLSLEDSAMMPFSDVHATAEYRKEVTPVVIMRALRRAAARQSRG